MVSISRILACHIQLLISIMTGIFCLVSPDIHSNLPRLRIHNLTLSDLYKVQLRLEQLADEVQNHIRSKESEEMIQDSSSSGEDSFELLNDTDTSQEIHLRHVKQLVKRSVTTESPSGNATTPIPTSTKESETNLVTVSPSSEAFTSQESLEANQTSTTESPPIKTSLSSLSTTSAPTQTTTQTSTTASSTPGYKDPPPRIPYREPLNRAGRFMKTPPPECQRLSQDELVKELKERGTYNPDFMAWDVPGVIRFLEKASAATSTFDKPPETRRQEDENLIVEKNIATLERVMKELDVQCDLRTSEVLQKIHNFTTSRDSVAEDLDRLRTRKRRQVTFGKGLVDYYARNKYIYNVYRSPSRDDPLPPPSNSNSNEDEESLNQNSITDEPNIVGKVHIVPFGCSKRGSEEEGYLRLCGACQAIRKLPDDFFPPFINEVLCDVDKACLYFYDYPHGKCKQKHMNFVVLRNLGSRDCQIWEKFNLNVRVSCECFVDEMSFFAKYV